MTAETVVPGLEDAEDYEAFQATVIADYDAESAVERELVLRLASLLWRLRRASGVETALFEMIAGADGGACSTLTSPTGTHPASRWTSDRETQPSLLTGFLRLMELPTAALDRLSRYEYMLWRQARQILFSLEHMRRCQRGYSQSRRRYAQFEGAGWGSE